MNTYFSHDSNARNSDKLIPVRAKMGAEGYGIYFMLLERLREEPGYMSVKDYNMLAFDLRVDAAKVKAVIENFGLFVFTDDGKYFYSESFTRRMQVVDEKSEKARGSVCAKWGISSSRDKTNSIKRSERLSAARKIATHTQDEWEEMKSFFGHCVICGKSLGEVKLVKDHIKPIYQGGSDGISNLQPLCGSCNSRKGPDAKDYRLEFCERHGLEMATKWLRNACEMPTIKEKEIKENKINIPPTNVVPPYEGGTGSTAQRFRPPSIEEVRIYISEKGYSVDAEEFVSFYESKGWMIGKNKMKNWHSAVATWQKREKDRPKGGDSRYNRKNDRHNGVTDWE